MTALVTGGGGFLGLHIVEQLIARGETVRALCRGRYPRLDELGVVTSQADIRDAEAVRQAVRGCDTVYHVAAVPGVWGSWEMFHSINAQGTENVIAGCRAEGAKRLIHTSSPSVVYDGRPHENANESLPYPESYLCHYPRSKALAEKAALAANGQDGLATVALRPHLIWGPRDNHLIPRLIQRAKSGRLRVVGDRTNLISISYVENAARAHLQAADALTSPRSAPAGKAYFINEPEPANLWDWVDELLGRAGLPPVRKRISAAAARRLGAALEGVWSLFRLSGEPPMTRFVASQLSESHWYDISAARRDFGYDPAISVAEGLRRMQPDLERLGK